MTATALTEKQMLFKLLDTIEGVIQNDESGEVLSREDLEDYTTIAISAHKKYGRKCPMVHEVVNALEGLGIGTLAGAGLTQDDYRAAYQLS